MTVSRQRARLGLAALAASTLAAKLALAWRYDGFLTGDDLEVVETAGKYAWGLAYQPWTLRSLFHPLLFVFPIVRLAVLAGARSPKTLVWVAVVPHALLSSGNIILVYLVARAWKLGRESALAASFLYAVHWLPLAYGSMTYPRPLSTFCFLAALLLVQRSDRAATRIGAGFLGAAAFAIRFSEGVLLVPLLAMVFLKNRRPRDFVETGLGAGAGILLFVGFFDRLTWGTWFFSLREFFRIMGSGSPPAFPHSDNPWFWYGSSLLQWAGPIPVLLLLGGIRDRRGRQSIWIMVAVVVLMSAFRYKTYRYVQAAVPFLCVAAAVGLEALWRRNRLGRAIAVAAVILSVPYGTIRTLGLLRGKSQSAVEAARAMASSTPAVVVLEQAWAYGERLYLGNSVEIRDLAPERPLRADSIRPLLVGADQVGFYTKDLSPAVEAVLGEAGFTPVARIRRDESLEVRVYRSARR